MKKIYFSICFIFIFVLLRRRLLRFFPCIFCSKCFNFELDWSTRSVWKLEPARAAVQTVLTRFTDDTMNLYHCVMNKVHYVLPLLATASYWIAFVMIHMVDKRQIHNIAIKHAPLTFHRQCAAAAVTVVIPRAIFYCCMTDMIWIREANTNNNNKRKEKKNSKDFGEWEREREWKTIMKP